MKDGNDWSLGDSTVARRIGAEMRVAPERWLAFMVGAVALVVAAPSLRNGFAYDDVTMVVTNLRVTSLQAPLTYFGQSYWPGGGLYRPVTVMLLALLWKIGGGSPLIFHLVNVALNAWSPFSPSCSGAGCRVRPWPPLPHSSLLCTRFMSKRWPTSSDCPSSSVRRRCSARPS